MAIPVLETERLTLREWRQTDVDGLARMYVDHETMRFISDSGTATRDEAAQHVNDLMYHWDEHGFGQWAVEERSSGEFVGRIGLTQRQDFDRDVEVGWVVERSRRGRGYATEGGSASIHHAFETLGLQRLVSVVAPDNVASRRVEEKLGLRVIAERESTYRPGFRVLWYGITRAEWLADVTRH